MMKRFETFFMVFQLPVDILMLLFSSVCAYLLRFTDWARALKPVVFDLTLPEYVHTTLFVIPLVLFFFAVLGLYSPDPNRKLGGELGRIFFALLASFCGVAFYVMFTQQIFDSRFLVLASFGFSVGFLFFGRIALRLFRKYLYTLGFGRRGVVVIGEGEISKTLGSVLERDLGLGYELLGYFDHFDKKTEKQLRILQPDEILFANPRARENEALCAIDFAGENNIVFKYSADLFSTYSTNSRVYPLGDIPVVELKRTPLEGWGAVLKRLFDMVGSVFLIVLFSPVMLFSALAIRLDSKGPIFFRYERIGRFGKAFSYLKFRSMVPGAHALRYDPEFRKSVKDLRGWNKKNPIVKYKDDPRITRVGRFLRRYSIDELPELFLVLKGDMSLVGPRPHEKEEVEKYQQHHKKVLILKPGITGMAQISGRSDLDFEDEVQLDLLYIEKWNIWLDLIILLKTPFVVFQKRKAL